MKKCIILLTVFLGALLTLTSCWDDDHKDEKPEFVVLVYMAADNDLSSYLYDDIREMMVGSHELNSRQKLVLFVDRRGQKPYLMEVSKGDTTRVKTFDTEMKSSDPATLQLVFQKVVKYYPCSSYGLVLWGHADGWTYKKDDQQQAAPRRAYGIDVTGGSTWMNIPEMAQALGAVRKLKFIFADCCAFQSVESAYELRNVTDYIIASPAEIPSEGAPYNTVIPALFSKDEAFYKLAVDNYFEQVITGNKVPLSVIKTSAMKPLADATRHVLVSFVPKLENSRYPDVSGLIYYYDYTLIDMNDFIMRYASDDEYTAWKKAFDEAVIYKTYTPRWVANHVLFYKFDITEERYGGMNMFVPMDVERYADSYRDKMKIQNENISKMQWYQATGLADLGW
ncbi:MAG: hypothetical protein IKN48_00455 [Bacteroidaceae bacterium]|nr:hypothetical protein [Bacteroidaceae bacterium]